MYTRLVYDLEKIKTLVRSGERVITLSALSGARELGFDEEDIDNVVLGLETKDFYKSMSADKFPGRWQDVYRPFFQDIELYLKLQICTSVVVISFKRK
ncbi:MAG: type II toxin-antitoxin system MqsR family toxin [Rectinemataceae bacterium]|nr:type II toxin-antitoxin system MqsR family toxin [Rectinemataceae bacterium]